MPGQRAATSGRRHGASSPVRLVLTRRALEDPILGQCGVCLEVRHLEPIVRLGADESDEAP